MLAGSFDLIGEGSEVDDVRFEGSGRWSTIGDGGRSLCAYRSHNEMRSVEIAKVVLQKFRKARRMTQYEETMSKNRVEARNVE
jgi:hypothetical protein